LFLVRWYQHADGICQVAQSGEQLFSLAEARRLTNLDDYSVMEIFEALAECADDHGYVSKEDFDNCFRKLILSDNSKNKKSKAMKEEEVNHINSILNRLFDLFDTDKSGRVDFSEISSGLSVLCGGTSDEKVRAAFALYDYNGDGYISLEEMTRYLTCVFKVLKEASPDSLRRISEQATTHDVEELGARTAEQAFLEADIDHDGRLSFEEFHKWYTSSSTANIERLIENNIPEWLSLREVRRLTNLETYTASEVFDVFADFSSIEGTLDKEAFHAAFDQLAAANNDPASNDRLRVMVERLFELFDSDKNGFVDFSELASGLSVLCGGHHVDKVRAAFNLYDVNNDGFVSLGEMRLYLTSVFKVLYEVNPETESRMGVSAEELATITAEQAFIDADRDHDGRLSFEEFSKWYMQAPTGETGIGSEEIAIKNGSHVPEWVSLEVVREMTHLEKHSASSVFELFAARCSDDGTLDRDSFELCFEELIDSKYKNDKEHMTRLRLILDRLFVIFDTDGNGVVDFCELSSGLSVLCGGSREDKFRSAFALYDLNQDGFISLEEMNRYLASVFKVLYETNPGTEQRLGVTSEVLALITAEQCFAEADLNHDGRLSFDEFVKWYSKGPLPLQGLPQTNGVYTVSGNAEMSDDGQVDEDKDAETSEVLDMNSSGMDRVRKLLKLDLYEVNDMLEIFAEAAPSGELTFAAFKKCFDQIIKLAGGHGSNEERQEAEQIIRRLFRAFDSDKSNTVDFGELASGLSVLSGSSLDDKVRAAFQLYDINGDGDISLDEMISYMTSIFKVMYETSDNAKNKMGVSPEELAKVTATQCFKEADLNHDQKLSFEEFKKVSNGIFVVRNSTLLKLLFCSGALLDFSKLIAYGK
jgi:Ca2+-binding EF-hand superfamily protein